MVVQPACWVVVSASRVSSWGTADNGEKALHVAQAFGLIGTHLPCILGRSHQVILLSTHVDGGVEHFCFVYTVSVGFGTDD